MSINWKYYHEHVISFLIDWWIPPYVDGSKMLTFLFWSFHVRLNYLVCIFLFGLDITYLLDCSLHSFVSDPYECLDFREATQTYKAEASDLQRQLRHLQSQFDMLTDQASTLIQGRRARVAATSIVNGHLTAIDDSLSARNLQVLNQCLAFSPLIRVIGLIKLGHLFGRNLMYDRWH